MSILGSFGIFAGYCYCLSLFEQDYAGLEDKT